MTGFLRDPSILMTLPICTVTARLHASGQSSGHAVSTTDVGPPSTSAADVRSTFSRGTACEYDSISVVRRVVILGGGFGGLNAARALAGAAVSVTLSIAITTICFSRCCIRWRRRRCRRATSRRRSAGSFDNRTMSRCCWRRRGRSIRAHRVALDGGDIGYDDLIVAAGAAHSYFGHPEWEARAPGLKTLDDALEMRRRVLLAFEAAEREPDPDKQRRLLTFVIVGGGPTGVELAGALAEIARHSLRRDFRRIRPESARMILLEGGPHVLPPFPDPLREEARRSLQRLGVEVRTDALVTGVDSDGVILKRRPAPAMRSPSVSPPRPCCGRLASRPHRWRNRSACRSTAPGRVTPQPTLALAAHPNILSSATSAPSFRTAGCWRASRRWRCSRAPTPAVTYGARSKEEPLEPFRYRDFGIMATIGRNSAVGDVFGLKISGFFAWVFWIFLHIFWLIGFRNRFVVMTEWAWAYFSLQRRVRLITGESAGVQPPEGP